MTEELKPCPFCGSTEDLQVLTPDDRAYCLNRPAMNGCGVVCWHCGLFYSWDMDYGGTCDTEIEAIESWNRRVERHDTGAASGRTKSKDREGERSMRQKTDYSTGFADGHRVDLKDRIKEARKAKGLTQPQLAELCGVTRQAVYYWESGKREPSLEASVCLAKNLDLNIFELIEDVYLLNSKELQEFFKKEVQRD